MGAFAVLCRSIVGITFLLSAAWKLRHREDFNVVVASSSWRLSRTARVALGPVVGVLEVVIGVGLLLFPTSWPLVLVAILFLVGFSVFLARAGSLANGCGCWRPVRRGGGRAGPYLARNALLIALAAAAGLHSYTIGIASEITLVAVALLPAWLIMEVPNFADLLNSPVRRVKAARIEGGS